MTILQIYLYGIPVAWVIGVICIFFMIDEKDKDKSALFFAMVWPVSIPAVTFLTLAIKFCEVMDGRSDNASR